MQSIDEQYGLDPQEPIWFVYIAYCEQYAKIGISPFPTERIKNFQTGCPFLIELGGSIPVGDRLRAQKVESAMHADCKHARIRGEWFQINVAIERFLQEQAAQSHKTENAT